ncbi:DUF6404 family protein [Vibrio parahaemolyticus]|uniref:DUF6404 family protein n=1 Tax=Vibrio parahaemolyticus TaxID=670 RepID=UPI0038917595
MKEDYERKYSIAIDMLKEKNIKESYYVKMLRRLGFQVIPFYFASFKHNLVVIFPFWFALTSILILISDYPNNLFIGLGLLPVLCTIVLCLYYKWQGNRMKLSSWDSL